MQWLALLVRYKRFSGFDSWLGQFCENFVCSPLSVWVPSGRFLYQYKDIHVGSIGDFKISLGLNVAVCLYISALW